MFSALTEVMEAKNNRLAHLREVILGNEKPEQRKLQPIRLMWLNRSQEQAVNQVLAAKEVAIVHGPPEREKRPRSWKPFMKPYDGKIKYWFVPKVTRQKTGLLKNY